MGFSGGLAYLVGEERRSRDARIQRARDYVVQRYAKERLLEDIESLYDWLLKK
jgi:hypothetical protein